MMIVTRIFMALILPLSLIWTAIESLQRNMRNALFYVWCDLCIEILTFKRGWICATYAEFKEIFENKPTDN